MIEIPLSKKGKYAGKYTTLISDEDSDLANLDWCVRLHKTSRTPYTTRRNGQSIHRIVISRMLGYELQPNDIVDHIDGNGLNNCRENLRLASPAESARNRGIPKNNTSGYKGVAPNQGKWQAQICVNRKIIYLGKFDTPEEARDAYTSAAELYHGEFARTA